MLLSLKDLTKTYEKNGKKLTAVDHVTATVDEGEIVALIGESGAGKSTVVRLICQFAPVDSGSITFDGQDITNLPVRKRKALYRNIQMVFQNPAGSFHPRYTLGHSIREGPNHFHLSLTEEEIDQLLQEVHLTRQHLERYPHQVSGGECQRAAIMRAICIKPKLLICDEATSALDVSTRGEIAALIQQSCARHHIACLFVTHDLDLARLISTRTIIMHEGKVINAGPTATLFPSSPT